MVVGSRSPSFPHNFPLALDRYAALESSGSAPMTRIPGHNAWEMCGGCKKGNHILNALVFI